MLTKISIYILSCQRRLCTEFINIFMNRVRNKSAIYKGLLHKEYAMFFYAVFSSARAAYNVVKDHGNASSAVTKYPFSKHISRACNFLPSKSKGDFQQ